ncbi:hypothetical protein HN51_054377, partial [Arachis hypogaea]
NCEAARKSRLRKKAYVQQLENSRVRLAQLEQELQSPNFKVCSSRSSYFKFLIFCCKGYFI